MRSGGAWWTASALAVSLACPSAARADDALEAARRLYAAAAYEDALKTLERLRPAAAPPVEAAAAAPVPPRIYDATYPGLAVPTIVRQNVPQWPRTLGPPPNRDAVLAIVINEKGLVESARMTRVVHRTYDQLLLNAVSSWAYVPAQLAGEPVKFRKVLKLSFR